jgi:hypothetical protein
MAIRECVFYTNLRQAYLLSPLHANRLASRTILFSCVPRQDLDEARIRKIFGDSVKNVWISRDTDELDRLVKEREQTAFRLERAEITLIKKANQARLAALKNGHPDVAVTTHHLDVEANDKAVMSTTEVSRSPPQLDRLEFETNDEVPRSTTEVAAIDTRADGIAHEQTAEELPPSTEASEEGKTKTYEYVPPPDINGSVASQWLSHSKRPSHRPLANYFRRVDTIKWSRSRLKILSAQIGKLRRQLHRGTEGTPIPSIFVEFDSQVNAQSAYQSLAHHRPNHMAPKFIGVRPFEVVWPSLRFRWWELIVRRFAINAFVVVMVIFWSIPCALVGIISNIKFLAKSVPFLGWINQLPSSILGIISGLLPALALAYLMSLVPAIMRSTTSCDHRW